MLSITHENENGWSKVHDFTSSINLALYTIAHSIDRGGVFKLFQDGELILTIKAKGKEENKIKIWHQLKRAYQEYKDTEYQFNASKRIEL